MVSQLSFLSLFAALTIFITNATAQQCYALDGSPLDSTYTPCNPNAKHSGCCATKRTNASPDICLDNGLCMATQDEQIGMIWQSGCTDKTGRDVACPRMCPDASSNFDGLNPVTAWQVQTCDYGTYCCRAAGDRKSCCNDQNPLKISTNSIGALRLGRTTTATTSNSDSNASKQATAMFASDSKTLETSTAPSADLCKEERQKVATVGAIVGGLCGTTILALLGTIYWMYTRERRQRRLKEHYEEQFSQTNAYRRALASTASLRGSIFMEELRPKSSGVL